MTPQQLRNKIVEILEKFEWASTDLEPERTTEIEKAEASLETRKEFADLILVLIQKVRQEIIKEFTEGKRCLNCGGKKESKLTDWCDKCLEEN